MLSSPILQHLIKVQYGSSENSRRLGTVCLVRPFMRSVRDTILGPCEHHCGWTLQLGHGTVMRGVCSCSYAFVTTSSAYAVDCLRPELPRFQMENARGVDIQTMRARDLASMRHNLHTHILQALELLVHQAENELGIRLYIATSDGAGLDVCGRRVPTSGMGKSV